MITGAGKNKPTKWGGGSLACKTSFKSKVSFRSKKGKSIPVKTQDGEYLFEGVQPGDTLYYQVETGADDKKGDSDEYYFSITSLNWQYLIPIVNRINQEATPAQLKQWEAQPNSYIEYVATQVNPTQLILQYFSQIEKTDENGDGRGSLKIPTTWNSGPMQISLMYGYNDDARSSDFSRAFSNVFDVLSTVALALFVIALFVACPFSGVTCAIGAGVLAAIDIAELAVLTYEQATRGLMANIGLNQYGCSFPEGGYVQIYNMFIMNESVDPFKLIDKPAFEKVDEEVQISNNEYVAKSMWNKNTAMILIASAGFILAINSIVGGD